MPNQIAIITPSLSMHLLAGFLLIFGSALKDIAMKSLSVTKEENVKVVEAIIEVLKKEFSREATTILGQIIRVQINV